MNTKRSYCIIVEVDGLKVPKGMNEIKGSTLLYRRSGKPPTSKGGEETNN